MSEPEQSSSTTPTATDAPAGGTPHSGSGSPHMKNNTMALIAYIIFFVPLLTDAKDDPFVKYHVKQGLVLFLAWIAISFVSMVPPIYYISPLLHLGMFVLMVMGILHALHGKEAPLPIIGKFAEHFNF